MEIELKVTQQDFELLIGSLQCYHEQLADAEDRDTLNLATLISNLQRQKMEQSQ